MMLAILLSFWGMEPHDVRTQINQRIFATPAETPEVGAVKDITVKSVPLRIYTPPMGENFPIVLMIHGGAWVAGNLDTHDNMARYLCQKVGALVVSVGYTNAPEGQFPLPLEQSYEALLWIHAHAAEFHADPQRIAVVGDSAGGNMAAALALMDRDRGGPKLALQVLINPSPDLTGSGDNIRWYAAQYAPNDADNPYVSQVLAKDLTHLPPALVILAENDELRGDGARYAERLMQAGVPTNVYMQWGIGHLAGQGARASPKARESLDVAAAALRGAFLAL